MKTFYFDKKDDIYSIIQVIEKIPSKYKKVIFSINKENNFFDNTWFVKLVLEKAKEKGLDLYFLIENNKQENILKSLGANYKWKKIPLYKKIKNNFFEFLEMFKLEHWFYKKHYNIIKIIFLLLEIWFVLFSVYYIYNLVTPKTEVYIQPAVKIKHLVRKIYIYPENEKNKYHIKPNKPFLAYHTANFEKTYSLKLPVKDINYNIKPAYWIVELYNETYQGYSLKARTLLKTEDWLLFRIQNWVYLPWKKPDGTLWKVKVKVKAEPRDENGNLIWEEWNLLKWDILYIKKLYISYAKKKIYAKVYKDFVWWESNPKWEVTLQDIDFLKKQLLEKFKKNIRKSIAKYIQMDGNKKIFLDKLYWFNDIKYEIYSTPWDKTPYIKWDIKWNIYFSYLNIDEIKSIFDKYLKDRIVSINSFIWYDENSISIIKIENITKNLYLATVSINALLWYDFDEDYNFIIPQIIEKIRWKKIKEAKNIILSFPEVAAVDLKTTNALNRVSKLRSRIYIKITK